MPEINRSADCGNSPKNQLVEDLSVALAIGDRETLSALVTDDVVWRIVGSTEFEGRAAVLDALSGAVADGLRTLTVHHVMTHGKAGAVDGTVQANANIAFCDVVSFSSARGTHVRQITSYRIETP